jgi:hypothetical protein
MLVKIVSMKPRVIGLNKQMNLSIRLNVITIA